MFLWASFVWGLPAEAPTAEGDVLPADPWAGVRISDAYDYAKCPRCGKENEIRAEVCSRCGYELPLPAAEIKDPAWVFVPGKGYYPEGALIEPAKTIKGLWVSGLALSALGISTIFVALIWTSETGGVGPAFYSGLGAMALGGALIVVGVTAGTGPVYAFGNGGGSEPYERRAYTLASRDAGGAAFKVEVTALGF